MSIQWFLQYLNAQFDSETSRDLIQAYRQDPLVWKALSTLEHPEDWIALAGNNLFNWQVARFALYTLKEDLLHDDFSDLSNDLPDELQHKSARLLETIRLTGLEPNNLNDITLLALALRNFRLEHDGWEGLAGFLSSTTKHFELWKSAFVVLPALVPDTDDAFTALIETCGVQSAKAIASLLVHSINTQALHENDRFQRYTMLASEADLTFQIALLQALEACENQAFVRLLASNFVDTDQMPADDENNYESIEYRRKHAILEKLAGLDQNAFETIGKAQDGFQHLRASFLHESAKALEKIQAEEARKTWEEVLSLDPDNETYISEYAEFLIAEGDVHQALYLLNTLSDRSASMLYALRFPAFAEIQPGGQQSLDPEQIGHIIPVEKSRFLQQSDKFLASKYAFDTKNYDLAQEFITKALLEDPNDLETIKLSGEIYQRLANLKEAIQSFALLSAMEPENPEHKTALTSLYVKAQEPQKAFETFGELLNANPHPTREDSLYYASLAIDSGQAELAIPIAQNFLAQDSLDGEAMVILSEAYIKNERPEEARELLSQASALAPEKADSWLALARIWLSLGEAEQALNSLQKAQVALPQDAKILTALGKLYLEQGLASEAVSTLKQAIQIEADNMQASISLCSGLLKQGKIDEAWEAIQPFENDFNSDPELALVLANTLAARNETLAALGVYKFAWQSLRSNESLQAYLSCLLSHAQQEEVNRTATIQDLEDLLPTLQDRNATYEASFEMKLLESDIKAELGNLDEAYEDYLFLQEQAEANAPRFYQHLRRQIGLVALDLGFEDISMAALQEAISFNPNDLASRHALSQAYLKSNLIDEAVHSAEESLSLAPSVIENVLWYSKFMQNMNRPHDAIQALKDAIYKRPDEQILHLSLARVYLANKAIDESKITLTKMLETADISTADYLNIANLYARMDESHLATEILQRAIADNANPSFTESCEIVYALLDQDKAKIALDFLDSLKQKHGQQSCFGLLRTDALTSEGQYLPAFEALEPILRRLEQGQTDYLQSSFNPDAEAGYLPFDNTGAYLRAAHLQRAITDFKTAKQYSQEALITDPQDANAQILRVEIAFAMHDREGLDAVLDQLNAKENRHVADEEIARLLILDALLEDESTKAGLIYEHFLSQDDTDIIPTVANALLAEQDGQEHQAMAFLQIIKEQHELRQESKAKTLSGQFAEIWRNLAIAKLAWQMQDWDFADKCFNQCLSNFKTNPRVNLCFADYLADKARMVNNSKSLRIERHLPKAFSSNRIDEAIFDEQINTAKRYLDPQFTQAIDIIGKAQFQKILSNDVELEPLLTTSRLATQALAVLENPSQIAKIQTMYPHDDALRFQYALHQLKKQSEKATELLKDIAIKPSRQTLHFAALALAQSNTPELAEESINRALAIWDNEPEWYALRAGIQKGQDKLSDAAESLDHALKLEPNRAKYWQALGEIKLLEKDLYAANSHYKKANSLQANNNTVLESLYEINRKLGETQTAIEYMQELHLQEPKKLEYLELLAELYFITQDYDKAISHADRVIESSLACERALKVKIETLIALHSFEEAKKLANDAMLIAKDPISFEIYRIRIEARENPTAGLRAATNLAHEHPEYPNVLNLLAQYQMLAEQNQNAEKTLIQSLHIKPDNPETLLALGALNRLNNNHETAQVYLKKALEIDPSLIEAYLELGQSFEDQRMNDEALHTYNKAIEQVSKDPRPYVHAANAYKASRDFRSAELMLQQAAQLAPADQSIRRQLAAIVAQNLVTNLQEAPKRK